MRAVWAAIMMTTTTGAAPAQQQRALPASSSIISPLMPRIERGARALASLANLNRTIHLPTYNKVLFEASAAE